MQAPVPAQPCALQPANVLGAAALAVAVTARAGQVVELAAGAVEGVRGRTGR